MNTPTIVSMKDIRLSLATIARRVEAGESFIVVRDSKPVFQIEPLSGAGANPQRGMTFDAFTQKVDSIRDAGESAWTPEAVEQVIQEMYRDGVKKSPEESANPKTSRKRRNRRS